MTTAGISTGEDDDGNDLFFMLKEKVDPSEGKMSLGTTRMFETLLSEAQPFLEKNWDNIIWDPDLQPSSSSLSFSTASSSKRSGNPILTYSSSTQSIQKEGISSSASNEKSTRVSSFLPFEDDGDDDDEGSSLFSFSEHDMFAATMSSEDCECDKTMPETPLSTSSFEWHFDAYPGTDGQQIPLASSAFLTPTKIRRATTKKRGMEAKEDYDEEDYVDFDAAKTPEKYVDESKYGADCQRSKNETKSANEGRPSLLEDIRQMSAVFDQFVGSCFDVVDFENPDRRGRRRSTSTAATVATTKTSTKSAVEIEHTDHSHEEEKVLLPCWNYPEHGGDKSDLRQYDKESWGESLVDMCSDDDDGDSISTATSASAISGYEATPKMRTAELDRYRRYHC